jgi:hypothetical protein
MESANKAVIEVNVKLSEKYMITNYSPAQQFSTVTTIIALVLARRPSSPQSSSDST